MSFALFEYNTATRMLKTKSLLTLIAIFLGGLLVVWIPSCTHEPSDIEELDTVCFDTQVLPILQTSCGMMGCHDGSEEGFDASNYQTIMQSVTPGDPRGSSLYTSITNINGEQMMPPDRPLTKEQRTIIQVWIAQGALEITCDTSSSGIGSSSGNNIDATCFVQDILPMVLSSCGTTGCHDAATHEEGYTLIDYNSIMQKGIVPYNASESKIYQVVKDDGEDRMPPSPGSPLTPDQIAALRRWINEGALNSDCPPASCDTTGIISFSGKVEPLLQSNCIGCHNSTTAGGGVNLASYNQVKTWTETLRSGTPVLTGAIRKKTGFVSMPPTFSLNECSIRTVELWISQGGDNN